MIEHTYRELYNKGSVDKQFSIVFDGGEITNSELYQDGVELSESLCSESSLRFGTCEASTFKMKIANTFDSFKGKWLIVSQGLDGDTENTLQIGKYKVYSDIPSGDRNYRNITAYDSMYDIINSEVHEWYENISFPITLREFRNSFFEYLGISQREIDLPLDNLMVDKTIDSQTISGKDVITAICEINGVFGHISRDGLFVYVSLENNDSKKIDVDISLCKNCEFEDYVTLPIDRIQIRQEDNDIGASYGSGDNCFVIQDNFLVYGKDSTELESIAEKLYEKIANVSYRPFKAVVIGNPCNEVGDFISINTRNGIVKSYILERTLSGIQALYDSFTAQGEYECSTDENSVEKELIKLKGKTNTLERNVDETKSTISDVESNLESKIEQTANEIALAIKQNAMNEEQLAKISLEVSRILNSDGISKNSAIEYYETQEVPTLENYPTNPEFFSFFYCSDTLYCSDDLVCGTAEYDKHLSEIAKDVTKNQYYIFEKNESGEYTWRNLTEDEVERLSSKNASVKVTENGVVISATENEESAQLEITSKGVKATVLYCC